MSTTPERSDQRPARQARINGTPRRMPEPKIWMKVSNISMPRPSDRWLGRAAGQQHRDGAAEHVLQRAGKQHDEALDDDDHVPADLRLVECEFGAALVEHADQDRGENDAHRMCAS